VIITLLRFIGLNLPICAGIELKTPRKDEKQRKVQNRQKHQFACHQLATVSAEKQAGQFTLHQLAMASPKASMFQRAPVFTRLQLTMANGRRATRNGECIYSRGELGRLKLLKGDVSQTHW